MQNCTSSEAHPTRKTARTRNKKSPAQPTIRQLAETWAKASRWPQDHIVAKDAAAAFGHLHPPQLNSLIVGALVHHWRQRHKNNTAYAYRAKLTKLLAVLAEFGAPPIKPPRVPFPKARPTVATGEELYRLLKEPAAWLRLFILLYLQCGLRRAEALAVTPRTWNREAHTVTIQVKGGRTRTAEITPDVEALLISAGDPDPDTPFIHALRGRAVTSSGIRHAWVAHRKKCAVNPELTAHDLRRSAATILYAATKDLRIPQQLLGHQNLASTLKYLAPMHPDEARKYQELLRFEHFKSEVKQ